jgi:glycosyltransferase involved in cell wall biosynthesis
MKLGIDAREIQDGVYTGIGGPLANFLHYFASQPNNDTCVLFSARKVPIDFGPKVSNIVIQEHVAFVWDQWQLPQALNKEGIDVFYSPYYKIPLLKPCRTISAILDLMYLTFEPYYKGLPIWAKLYYSIFGKAFAKRADVILTCSLYSKGEIKQVYGIADQKIKVIPLSVSDIYYPEAGPVPVDGRYILYVGNFKLHKNVSNIIKAFALIAADFPDLKLVLAGPKEHTYEILETQVNEYGLTQRVVFLGKITEKDNPRFLYSKAKLVIMPSWFEGFGLPALEAMACGVPVVAANTTSIPEVVKDAGLLVSPDDTRAMADAIKLILNDEDLRKKIIAKGLEYSKEYKPSSIARQMYDLFKS